MSAQYGSQKPHFGMKIVQGLKDISKRDLIIFHRRQKSQMDYMSARKLIIDAYSGIENPFIRDEPELPYLTLEIIGSLEELRNRLLPALLHRVVACFHACDRRNGVFVRQLVSLQAVSLKLLPALPNLPALMVVPHLGSTSHIMSEEETAVSLHAISVGLIRHMSPALWQSHPNSPPYRLLRRGAKAEFRVLASFETPLERDYLHLFEAVFIILIGTLREPPYETE